MTKLSNAILRKKMMEEFLIKMGIDSESIEICSIEGLFGFTFKNAKQAEWFAEQLNNKVEDESKGQNIKSITLAEIIYKEIEKATCDDKKLLEIHRMSCQSLFGVIKDLEIDYFFSQESGFIELVLPNKVYANLLNLLKYPDLICDGEKLKLNIKAYFKNISENVIKIEGLKNSNQPPVVFLNSGALESKKIFYVTKELEEGRTEITPYIVVPKASKPPKYHFALDISTSMKNCLPQVKKNIIELAEELFKFQPKAQFDLTVFSSGIRYIGTYDQGAMSELKNEMDKITVVNDTPLYEVTYKKIKEAADSDEFNNILIFSDGKEQSQDSAFYEKKLINYMASLEKDSKKIARNKLYVFSYGVTQGNTMQKVVETLHSEVILAKETSFINMQENKNQIIEWAQQRDIFNSRILIKNNKGSSDEFFYSMTLDMSGQLVSLKSVECQPGETLEIVITDGDNNKVVESTKKIACLKKNASNANLISHLGIYSEVNSSKSELIKTDNSHEELNHLKN